MPPGLVNDKVMHNRSVPFGALDIKLAFHSSLLSLSGNLKETNIFMSCPISNEEAKRCHC